MKLEHSGLWSDSSRSAREVDRNSSMATEGHKRAEKKSLEADERSRDG
jgi:hypothetical protein